MSTPSTLPWHEPLDPAGAYRALQTRDARFDGRLFVGVTSTGIYCRPVCRVRLPRAENCRFFPHAAAAETAGFRPCLRCRPEQAPGLSSADAVQSLADAGAHRINQAVAQGEAVDLCAIAATLGVTERHLRRIFQQRFGVSPHDWWSTQRLLLAKQLLTDTDLPMVQVAAACGFGSLRRFNASFVERYRMAPGALRRESGHTPSHASLLLPWRAPYDHRAMFDFLGARPLPGVEAISDDGQWHRTLALPWQGQRLTGWISLRADPARQAMRLDLAPTLAPALGLVRQRVRQLLDLDTDPAPIASGLQGLPVPPRDGLRVPGCIDGFETTVRIILGQQVSVAAACTLAGRLVARFGEPFDTSWPALNRLFPTARTLATAPAEAVGELGIVRTRVAALQALARAVDDGVLNLSPEAPLQPTLAALRDLPGVGDWTAELVALRVLAWPDAFPASDAGVIKALGGERAPASLRRAEAWRPWRSYAVMQLWQSLRPHLTEL